MKVHVPIVLALVMVLAGAPWAAQKKEDPPASSHRIVEDADLKWTPMLLKGATMAVVSGDPNQAGTLFVIRIRNIDGTRIPAHWHPEDENITVLKGKLLVGMGERFDETKLQAVNAGGFALIPKEMRHFAIARGETIYQIHGVGPFKVNWVNPAEVTQGDARK
jgi:quercetin dioxygenase-like cupin family protein